MFLSSFLASLLPLADSCLHELSDSISIHYCHNQTCHSLDTWHQCASFFSARVHPSPLSGIPTPKSEGNCLLLAWLQGSCCHLSPSLSRFCTSRPLLCILPKVASGVALLSLLCVQQGGVGEHDGHYSESETESQGYLDFIAGFGGQDCTEEMRIRKNKNQGAWRYWVWIQGPMALPFSILTLSSIKLEAWGPGEPRGVPGRCRERNEPQVVSCNYQELLPGR